ncbi:MAG TPA: hypothetical protein VER55_00220, partial [Ardenticatenaceae bacterium]|nr:hypothetical protein [Ardenticatenaceae bacterium]
MIACLRIPQFAASLERRREPALARRPLILGEHERVYAASDEVVRSGVQPGMPLRAARACSPRAHVLPARPEYYARALAPVHSLLADFGTAVEPEEAGHVATCYLDLGDLPRGLAIETATEMGRAVRATSHLEPALGIASGKFPANVAAGLTATNHALYVAPGRETALLGPLPIETLPLDAEMARRLRLLGIRTVGQFAALPAGAVLAQFGRPGRELHRLAQGRDDRPLRPRVARPSEQLAHHFDDPVSDRVILAAVLHHLAALLWDHVRQRRVGTKTLWLLLEFEDRSRCERRRCLREPLGSAESLEQTLLALLAQVRVRCGVVTLQVLATDFAPLAASASQLTLFGPQTRRAARLHEALPAMVERYG